MNGTAYSVIALAVASVCLIGVMFIYKPGMQGVGNNVYQKTNTTLVGSHIHEQPSNNP